MLTLEKSILNRFDDLGAQILLTDPIIVLRYHNPEKQINWFLTAYDPEEDIFYGIIHDITNNHIENSYIKPSILEQTGTIKDDAWKEKPYSQIKKDYKIT